MKIFSASQTQKADAFTIANEPISSIDLMERASLQIFHWLEKTFQPKSHFNVFCGSGNNGGDGLAVARMLANAGFRVSVYYVDVSNPSDDNQLNQDRLDEVNLKLQYLTEDDHAFLDSNGVIIDSIFGSGLTRPVTGWVAKVIEHLNSHSNPKVSIDIASGLFAEDNDANEGVIFQPDHTLTFELEKLAFQFPENQAFVGNLKVLPIGLHSDFISSEKTDHFITSKFHAKLIHKKGHSFAYKNTFGHALIVAGSKGKMGAAVLSSQACIKSGAGLVTAHIPKSGNNIMQVSVPEVMTIPYNSSVNLNEEKDLSTYQCVGVGPGLGQKNSAITILNNILDEAKKPMVIDADALNMLATNKEALKRLPAGSILTPHLGEWRRLVGEWEGAHHRLALAKEFCATHKVFVILKGAKSSVVCPDGEVYFNPTGNAGMATAGSGDVLTGILTALLAQNYAPKQAAILGVFVHGLAGDLARNKESRESLIASDIIAHLGIAFKEIERCNISVPTPLFTGTNSIKR